MSADSHRFVVHAAEQGSAVMLELARWLVAALADAGRVAAVRTGGVPRAGAGVVNLVVAPHEYFELALSDPADRAAGAAVSIPVCTEQPGTPGFEVQQPYVALGPLALALHRSTVRELELRGVPALHLPFGRQAGLERHPYDEDTDRPFDVVFLGTLDIRRESVLASMAPHLQSLRCRLLLFEQGAPLRDHTPGAVLGAARADLLARTKVLVHIHRADQPSFDTVRAVEAVAAGAVVLTEPSLDLDPFRAVDHVVTAPAELLGVTAAALVADPAWRSSVRTAALEHLMAGEGLAATLGRLVPPMVEAAERVSAGRSGLSPGSSLPVGSFLPVGSSLPVIGPAAVPEAPSAAVPPEDGLLTRVLLAQTELRRRVDRLECLVRTGAPELDEVVSSPGFDAVVPDVSVVIPCFDYGRFVIETIESVLASQGVLAEVIVVDDHSRDDSAAVVRSWLAQNPWAPLRLVARQANGGLSEARNTGFEHARAPYVFPLDADDLLYPHCLARLLDALRSTDAAAAYGMLEVFGARRALQSVLHWDVGRLVRGPYIAAPALFRKEVWHLTGGYSSDGVLQLGWEDYDMWLNLAAHGLRAEFVPEIVGRYRNHGDSMVNTTNTVAPSLRAFLRRRHPNLPWPGQPAGPNSGTVGT